MKELVDVLDDMVQGLSESLIELDYIKYPNQPVTERVRGIQVGARHLASLCQELRDEIEQRVYEIQVTTSVDMNIKVLAKNEDDAIELACETADKRINRTLGQEYDVYYDSVGEVLGHESPKDDEADEEYPYDV